MRQSHSTERIAHHFARGVMAALVLAVVTAAFAWGARPSVTSGASAGGPHADLTSSPFGCPVCHGSGVIFAWIAGSGGGLESATDEACVRCHVLPGGKGPKVYAGDEAHYRVADGFGHNDPSKVSCLDCHSIHGPHFESPALAGKLLRRLDVQRGALASVDVATASHDRALSVWCTGCHKRWPLDNANHPFGPKGGTSWRECTSCLSCHAAAGGFPHYTPGADAGLVGAASSSEKRVNVTSRNFDGVCLGCHRNGAGGGDEGVGISY